MRVPRFSIKNPFTRSIRLSVGQLQVLYLVTFFVALHAYLPAYASSTFLETFVSRRTVGLVFSVAALISLAMLVGLPRVLNRLGLFRTVMLTGAVSMSAALSILFIGSGMWVLPAFIVFLTTIRLLFYSIDIFVEELSDDMNTGSIRGAFLTSLNLAIFLSPLIAGLLIGRMENYTLMFGFSVFFLLPALALLVIRFRNVVDPIYERIRVRQTTAEILRDKNLFGAFTAQFLLRFFYAWIVIYAPLYLIETIGFEWTTLGAMFTVALVPFLILEFPLGSIADRILGEKEMLIAGLVIVALATMSLSLLHVPSIVLWTLLLFITRIGASIVETMSESYFFKHINESDTQKIALFRILDPLAYLAVPLVAAASLSVLDLGLSFIVLGTIMLFGILAVLPIQDSK